MVPRPSALSRTTLPWRISWVFTVEMGRSLFSSGSETTASKKKKKSSHILYLGESMLNTYKKIQWDKKKCELNFFTQVKEEVLALKSA